MKAYFSRRRLLMLLAVVIVNALLALILRDFVREFVIIPLLNLAWVAWIGLISVPQAIYWGIFLVLAVIIAVRSFSAGTSRTPTRFERSVQRYNSPSRYGYWKVGLTSITRSSFAHERVERELQNLVVQILAEQRRVGVDELRDQLFSGALDLSTEMPIIQDLLKLDFHTSWTPAPRGLAVWLARLFGRPVAQIAPRIEVSAVIEWLEEQTGGTAKRIDSSPQKPGSTEEMRSAT